MAAVLRSPVPAQGLLHQEISWENLFRGPGKVSFRADPAAFSPNGDGRRDSAFFFLGTQGFPDLSKWAITLENPRGHTVRRFTGKGSPPGLTEWNGRNAKDVLLPEGPYAAKAYVWGREGRTVSPKIQVLLDNTPPRLTVALSTASFSPGEASAPLTVSLRAEDSGGPDRWAAVIFVKDHDDVEVFAASGAFAAGQAALSWDGSNAGTGQTVPHGLYSVRATAWDAAGNEAAAPPLDVEVVVRPEHVLKQLAETLDVRSAADGIDLAVPSARLFSNPYGTDFSEDSLTLRQRLVYLVQSHPDHAVGLRGRNGTEKTGRERTDLSSAQAWALYSFLVKSGVSATRLSVQGLGGARGEINRIDVRLEAPPRPADPPQDESAGRSGAAGNGP